MLIACIQKMKSDIWWYLYTYKIRHLLCSPFLILMIFVWFSLISSRYTWTANAAPRSCWNVSANSRGLALRRWPSPPRRGSRSSSRGWADAPRCLSLVSKQRLLNRLGEPTCFFYLWSWLCYVFQQWQSKLQSSLASFLEGFGWFAKSSCGGVAQNIPSWVNQGSNAKPPAASHHLRGMEVHHLGQRPRATWTPKRNLGGKRCQTRSIGIPSHVNHWDMHQVKSIISIGIKINSRWSWRSQTTKDVLQTYANIYSEFIYRYMLPT